MSITHPLKCSRSVEWQFIRKPVSGQQLSRQILRLAVINLLQRLRLDSLHQRKLSCLRRNRHSFRRQRPFFTRYGSCQPGPLQLTTVGSKHAFHMLCCDLHDALTPSYTLSACRALNFRKKCRRGPFFHEHPKDCSNCPSHLSSRSLLPTLALILNRVGAGTASVRHRYALETSRQLFKAGWMWLAQDLENQEG